MLREYVVTQADQSLSPVDDLSVLVINYKCSEVLYTRLLEGMALRKNNEWKTHTLMQAKELFPCAADLYDSGMVRESNKFFIKF